MDKFGAEAADKVLHSWLKKKNKKLTNYQVRVLQNVFSFCSTPLFCKLAFIESIKWRSYFEKEKTFLKRFESMIVNRFSKTFFCSSIEASIEFLFEKIEKKFGSVLVQHAFSYITASRVR